ncbi:MAG: ATP-dependent helicase [Cellulomonas sp.]|nr:ATP-dependent helicase [Cellulomonas sp.]
MPTSPSVRLVRPALAGAPRTGAGAPVALDATQAAAVAAGVGLGGHVLVLGAPGTGKTTVAVETVLGALDAGVDADQVVLLAATRRAAGELRDRVAARLPSAQRPAVRTPSSLAFAVLRARAVLLGSPPPTLVSGPEQDLALAELLAGHAAGDGVELDWPEPLRAALGLRTFRGQLRDLLMRAAERGVDPDELAALGRAHDRPQWEAAARLYAEYLDTWALRQGTPDAGPRLDPAVVVDEAVSALATWEQDLPGSVRPSWRLVVLDDHQESTVATARLLDLLAALGACVVLTGDPDSAVLTFRGAQPALLARAQVAGPGPGELGARTYVLGTAWRQSAPLRAVSARVGERIGTVGVAAHRGARAPSRTFDDAAVRVALLPGAAQEAAFVAHRLRSAHLRDHVPWRRLAVVVRSGAQVRSLRRSLAAAGVPVDVLGSDTALRDEPACRPLLDAFALVTQVDSLDLELASTLLCGPLGGLDTVGLRHVRRALRAAELAAGGTRTSSELVVELVGSTAQVPQLTSVLARPVERLGRVLAAGRAAAQAPGADASGVLWALWDAAGLADSWRRIALAGGTAGERADRDLDAVLALFAAAQGFVERLPQAPPSAFVQWVRAQDLRADSLAPQGGVGGVQVLTPAGAAGREWDEVVVAGVQDGVWPDLRLRDTLLGAQALADLLAGRGTAAADAAAAGQARAAVLADELRSFLVACSRARNRLTVTAVSDTDEQPSAFVDLVQPPAGEDEDRFAGPQTALDLRALVAGLRARLVGARGEDQAAARTLARLAVAGVPGADPADWHGLAGPSTDLPLWAEGQLVELSPSKLETAQRCTLRWVLEAAGGVGADSAAASLGSLVHEVAAAHPSGTRAQLQAELERRWPALGLGDGWAGLSARRRAEAMIDRLALYIAGAGVPVAIEEPFELRTDRALVHGVADRVEAAARPGEVEVVDLKTGSTVPSKQKAAEHPQLAAYQLAVDAGALGGDQVRSAGARLVYLSRNRAGAVLDQPALGPEDDGPSWARTLIDTVADRMADSRFTATANEMCDRCPARRACPLRPEGRQVVGP